ncbi:DUF1343 domain-containing protein [bacterium]|nr:DUF1343 domain-containing protein [bacterium]
MPAANVKTGLEVLLADGARALRGQRVGLLCHPASVDARLRHAAPLLRDAGVDLRCLFGPQHGLRGETQDNMIEWEGFEDPATGLTVYSLYGEYRKPTPSMLHDIDTLVIDLQDVGARYYTFIWTMLHCLEACAEQKRRVVVLDRPNPLGGDREGNVLDTGWRSFVGLAPLPMRHGLTVGELALCFRDLFDLLVDLEVVRMEGWRPGMFFDETGLPWVMPSPNMPTLDTALVYPGMCLLEGTELSEGRGTTRPFEICGAPWIDPEQLAGALAEQELPGCVFRPLHFEPTFHKHASRLCGGVQIHVVDRAAFRSVQTAVTLLATVRGLWADDFGWRRPPYEYELERLPIDILAGGPALREAIDAGEGPASVTRHWDADLLRFETVARGCLRYGP